MLMLSSIHKLNNYIYPEVLSRSLSCVTEIIVIKYNRLYLCVMNSYDVGVSRSNGSICKHDRHLYLLTLSSFIFS